jgi:hypothetical protein
MAGAQDDIDTRATGPAQVVTFADANCLQRGIRRIAASRTGSWLAIPVLHRFDPHLFRLTAGKHTASSAAVRATWRDRHRPDATATSSTQM